MIRTLVALLLATAMALGAPAHGAGPAAAAEEESFSARELVGTGHRFFGTVSTGLASVIERAVSTYGEPNGYILGEEGGGAFVGGLRYGEGMLHLRETAKRRLYWQGPSLGFDFGGEGARTMMLVYNLPAAHDIYRRFVGIDGSVYVIGGFGMTALVADDVYVIPVRAGVGARLGLSVGYLKFTDQATWNPF